MRKLRLREVNTFVQGLKAPKPVLSSGSGVYINELSGWRVTASLGDTGRPTRGRRHASLPWVLWERGLSACTAPCFSGEDGVPLFM